MMSMTTFMSIHARQNDGQRLGQRFVNAYIKEPWPNLFYASDMKAWYMIFDWLKAHQYENELPPVLNPVVLGEKQ